MDDTESYQTVDSVRTENTTITYFINGRPVTYQEYLLQKCLDELRAIRVLMERTPTTPPPDAGTPQRS